MKSVLRYPGGKVKAIKYIEPFWDAIAHDEYREPFLGGGSVFLAKPLAKLNWINDLDKDLISFYKVVKDPVMCEKLVRKLLSLKVSRKQYEEFYFQKASTDFDRAVRYYYLNRCSFSGITRWNAYIGNVRYNIEKVQDQFEAISSKLSKVKITSVDFEQVISTPSKHKVFLFVDPPYAESRQVAAYNVTFDESDHIRLAKMLKSTNHKFLLTYDDCRFVRNLYSWANLYDRTWTYSVANAKVHHNPRESGNELFISNFPLPRRTN